jgi:hypothetical protein
MITTRIDKRIATRITTMINVSAQPLLSVYRYPFQHPIEILYHKNPMDSSSLLAIKSSLSDCSAY